METSKIEIRETAVLEFTEKVKIFWPLAIPANIIVISIIAVPVFSAIIVTLMYILTSHIIKMLVLSTRLSENPKLNTGDKEMSLHYFSRSDGKYSDIREFNRPIHH